MRSRNSSSSTTTIQTSANTNNTPSKHTTSRMHLPTPPPSFAEPGGGGGGEDGTTPRDMSRSTTWPRADELADAYRLSPSLRAAAGRSSSPDRNARQSMSPELEFPRLPIPGSARATPDRDARESSPVFGMERTPSPEPREDWRKSNSPGATVRPSPLRAMSEKDLNGKLRQQQRGGQATPGNQSVMSTYDMLASYQLHPHRDRRTGGEEGDPAKDAGPRFRPNQGLSKPISPSFIRDYNTERQVELQQQKRGCRGSTRGTRGMSPETEDDGEGSLKLSRTYKSDGTASTQSGDALRMSELNRQRTAMGWQYVPLPESRHQLDLSPSSSLTGEDLHKESLSTAYLREFSSQLDACARYFKKPLVTVFLIASVSIAVSMFSNFYHPAQSYPPSSNTSFGGNIDFPTLMSIETSFERVVDSAAGGSELARSLKQSEMAVADLSTVVKYSDLNCRETLSSKLESFAGDAQNNVLQLLEFSARVGGVLDELLSVNQYALRELTSLQSPISARGINLPWPLSVLFPSASVRARQRLAQTFDTAFEVLESNLRLLIANGQILQTGLMQLAQQNGAIRTEIVREFADIRRTEAEAMSSLWARISSPSAQRQNFKNNERLLSEINLYHDKARGYVEVTLLELGRMTSELDNLRRRVSEPLLVGKNGMVGEVDVEVQKEAVGRSVKTLERKRGDRDERLRVWNRIILEGRGIGGGIATTGE